MWYRANGGSLKGHRGNGDTEGSIEVGEISGVALYAGDVLADELHGLIELLLAASGDEDVRALFDEELCCCERHAGGRGGDDCYFLRAFPLLSLVFGLLGAPLPRRYRQRALWNEISGGRRRRGQARR